MFSFRDFLVATFLFQSLNSFAADIYVSNAGSDANPGTQALPYKTIQKGANVATAGSVVHVAAGTYAETIVSAVSGNSAARIRFVSDSKWKAIVVPTGNSNTMWSAEGGYTDIDGFQIDGSGSTTVRAGIYLNGGHSSVTNSLVVHVAEHSGCDNQGGAGLVADQGRGSTFQSYDFTNNIVHDVGGGCGWIQGIYHSSSGNISNNVVYATSQGINMGHDDHDINVVNNTLFGNSGYGVYYGGCQEAYNHGCPTSGIKIMNNIIYDNGGGVQGPVTAEDVNNEVRNNLVYGNGNDFDLASPSNNTRTGEINEPPQFVIYDRTGGGNYKLKSTSPAIDKGLSSYAPLKDIEGVSRPQGLSADIGAYEFISGISVISDTQAPVTVISALLNNQMVAVRSNVTLKAQASDNVAVKSVQFYVNGILKCSVALAPYQCVWKVPRQRGASYTLQTKAIDAAGNVGNSNLVKVKAK